MASDSIVIRSFAGGELAPSLAVRADVAKYTIGLRRCRNFIVERHGGVANRPGSRYIAATKTTSIKVRLVRYVSEIPDESVLIEMGDGYFRFYFHGALVGFSQADLDAWSGAITYEIGDLVTSGGVAYWCKKAHTNHAPPDATYWHPQTGDVLEVPHAFDEPREVNWVQSGRVITFTHKDNQPQDLVYTTLTRWALVPVDTTPKVAKPVGVVLTPTAGTRKFGYVVTAAAPGSYEESVASAQVIDTNASTPTESAPHELSWTAVLTPPLTGTTSPEYYIYCDPYGNGTYGFLGTATGQTTFRNPGLLPDFAITPPLPITAFAVAGEFPAVCAYHQQRRYFGNTEDLPDGVFASRVGFPDNYGISSPLQDDDAITFRIAGNNHHAVRFLVALKDLLILTDGGEWRLTGAGEVISPNTLKLDQETYVGCQQFLRPVVIGNSILYVQARGATLRDLRFDQDAEGLAGRDLTVFAAHLFDGYELLSLDFALAPNSIVWCCRSDGTLLGLTYLRDQDIWGWHRHDTRAAGRFEDVCVIPEPGEDGVYLITRRTIGGQFVRQIEKLESRSILDFDVDSFFVDAGLSYSGDPVSTVSGLGHLNGQEVVVTGDGTQVLSEDGEPFVVVGGAITLPAPYSNIHVGLPITAEIETLDLDVAGSQIRDKKKRVQSISAIVDASSRSFLAGVDSAHLTRYARAAYDPSDRNFTGQVELNISTRFNIEGRVFIRQDQPLPLTILGLVPNVELGG